MQNDIEIMADLLAKTAKISAKKDEEKTIEQSLEKIDDEEILDNTTIETIKDGIEQETDIKLSEEELQGVELTPNIKEYQKQEIMGLPEQDQISRLETTVARLGGEPSVKSFEEIEAEKCRCDDEFDKTSYEATAEQVDNLLQDLDDEEEDEVLDIDMDSVEDNEFDAEHNIQYDDIINFLQSIDDDEFDDIVDWDEYEDEFEGEDEEYDTLMETVRNTTDPKVLVEALTQAQRIKRSMIMKRNKAKIANKRKIALKRHATPEKIKQRARKMAINMLKKRYAHKAVDDMSFSEKKRVEELIAKRQNVVNRLERKMIPVVREVERERFKPKANS